MRRERIVVGVSWEVEYEARQDEAVGMGRECMMPPRDGGEVRGARWCLGGFC